MSCQVQEEKKLEKVKKQCVFNTRHILFLFSNGGGLKIKPKYFSPDNIVRKVHYFNSFDYVVDTNCKVARTY